MEENHREAPFPKASPTNIFIHFPSGQLLVCIQPFCCIWPWTLFAGIQISAEGWRQIQTTEVHREVMVRSDKKQWWGQQWVSPVIDRLAVRCLFRVFVEACNTLVKSHEESVYETQKPSPLFLLQMPDLCPLPFLARPQLLSYISKGAAVFLLFSGYCMIIDGSVCFFGQHCG